MPCERYYERRRAQSVFNLVAIYAFYFIEQTLPVLTVQGDSFPNRVADSLYDSFVEDDDRRGKYAIFMREFKIVKWAYLSSLSGRDSMKSRTLRQLMVTESLKAMEDAAVSFLTRPTVIDAAKGYLHEFIRARTGLFDSETNTHLFVHGMQAAAESYHLCATTSVCNKKEEVEYAPDGLRMRDKKKVIHVAISGKYQRD
jgi:hypothetical protein